MSKIPKKIILFSFNINVLSTVTRNQYIGSLGWNISPTDVARLSPATSWFSFGAILA